MVTVGFDVGVTLLSFDIGCAEFEPVVNDDGFPVTFSIYLIISTLFSSMFK